MHYQDLAEYRIDDLEAKGYAYYVPRTKNVGWLSPNIPFPQGTVSAQAIGKLRDLILLGSLPADVSQILYPHCLTPSDYRYEHTSGPVFPCPLCSEELSIQSTPTTGGVDLGRTEFCLPDEKRSCFYIFPDLLIHYIIEHAYLPPADFLEALEQVNLCGDDLVHDLMGDEDSTYRRIDDND